MANKIANIIWKTHGDTFDVRSIYLKSLHPTELNGDKYIDIGAGSCKNTSTFGSTFNNIYALDLKFVRITKDGIHRIVGNANNLPFDNMSFDCVSLISVIEHVQNRNIAINEAFRCLKIGGELIIQIPNKYFPVELHSGLPLISYFPLEIRNNILKKIGNNYLIGIDIPSLNELEIEIHKVYPKVKIFIKKVIYPPELIPPMFRPIYIFLRKVKILNLIPLGWYLVCKKVQ